jgi:hypothetical protein
MVSTYYNLFAPASYGGLSKFKPKCYAKKEVREWLQSQDMYTLHKPTRRRFPRRRVVVYGIDHHWQADLVDLAKLSSFNKGFKYLLTCIGVLSRYAWVVPLKDKTGKTLKDAFQVIFKSGRVRYLYRHTKELNLPTEYFKNFSRNTTCTSLPLKTRRPKPVSLKVLTEH